jgi:Zn-dependent peptidase ImmA (M78 family)
MARVDVSPEILKWAAHRAGKEDSIQEEFPGWRKWINNQNQPTFKQLESVAKATSTPLGYFFLPKPPQEQLPVPHYRTIDDRGTKAPSPNLLETVQSMQRRQEWMHDYLVEREHDPLDFVGVNSIKQSPINIAKEIRKKLDLEQGWAASCPNWIDALSMLLNKIEDIGVLVVVNGIVGNNTHRKLDVDEFRGFVLVDKYAPLIFVNNADGKAAQMFTLAHELAHIWLGVSAAFDLQELQPADNETEKICNSIAAEFLVPETELKEYWDKVRNDDERFNLLARRFKVSEVVAARRTLDLGLIAWSEFNDFYHYRYLVGLQKAPGASGGNFYYNQPYRVGRRFAEAVISATTEGKLLYQEAYRLTGLKGKTFANFAAYMGYGGNI